MGHLIIYRTIFFFGEFGNDLSVLLLCKIHVFDFFNVVNFFQIVFYIAKYWNSDHIKFLAASLYAKYP